MNKLKPCPLCGGVPHIDFAHGSNQTYLDKSGLSKSTPILYMVFCENCGIRTIPCENTKIATNIWNRRLNMETTDKLR